MASLIRYPDSRYWVAAFYDAAGRQRRRSTRETNKKRAQAVADQYEKVAKRGGSPQRVRQVFVDFYREHYGQDLPFASVRKFTLDWLAARKAETSRATHGRYGDAVTKFLAFLGSAADKGLDEVTQQQVAAFRDSRLAKSAVQTANTDLKIIRSVFRRARLDGFIFQDPAEGVKTVRNRDVFERRPFTIDELRAVLAVADSEWQSLIKFGLYTGQRLGDLANLTWSQIDLDRNQIRITTRKTGKALIVPIAGPLREHLLALDGGDYPRSPLHPRAFDIATRTGRVGQLSNQFTEILVDAGLRESRTHQSRGVGRSGKREGSKVSFHSLRHTAVSLLKDAGVPDSVVMALVGHESTAMSHRYTHVGKEALAKAARTLPEI